MNRGDTGPALVWMLLSITIGCGGAPEWDPIEGACDGERPASLSDCRRGLFYADCGGDDGDPTLACDEASGPCFWFAHGCLPLGFRSTACPVGDPCCESTADGSWPFADSWAPSDATGGAIVKLTEDIAAMGYVPVTASSPSTVAVTVDPSFLPTEPGVACEGPGSETLEQCNGDPLYRPSPTSYGETIIIEFQNRSLLATVLFLEIVPGMVGPIARTFVFFEDDAARFGNPLACETAHTPRLELSGALTTNAVDVANPTATRGRLVLDLPGGGSATIDF